METVTDMVWALFCSQHLNKRPSQIVGINKTKLEFFECSIVESSHRAKKKKTENA